VLPLKDNVPTRRFPIVTVGLIVANFAVWFWELTKPGVEVHVVQYGYYPCLVHAPCVGPFIPFHQLPWYESAFTSMFMHAGWEHILGNMLFLWIFGNNVEDLMGRVKFFVWYIAAGLAADVLQTLITLKWSNALGASVPNIGASGAISGVLGAYIVMFPHSRVLTLVPIFIIIEFIEIPAFVLLGIWFLMQLVSGVGSLGMQDVGGVAFWAHAAGFVAGALAIGLFKRPERQQVEWWDRVQ
jgi:membrane associated rhomboid family serine protease